MPDPTPVTTPDRFFRTDIPAGQGHQPQSALQVGQRQTQVRLCLERCASTYLTIQASFLLSLWLLRHSSIWDPLQSSPGHHSGSFLYKFFRTLPPFFPPFPPKVLSKESLRSRNFPIYFSRHFLTSANGKNGLKSKSNDFWQGPILSNSQLWQHLKGTYSLWRVWRVTKFGRNDGIQRKWQREKHLKSLLRVLSSASMVQTFSHHQINWKNLTVLLKQF